MNATKEKRSYEFWIMRQHGGHFELVTTQALDSLEAINLLPECVSWNFSTSGLPRNFPAGIED
jgi:hypothetical protein